MKPEAALARFVVEITPRDLSASALATVRRVVIASVGTGVAGAGEEGIEPLRGLLRTRGGKAEARTFIFGDRLPAQSAAQLNGTMCRALDYCDAMAPGAHLGSSVIPAACAAAELVGGCSGAEFVAALAAGCEVGSRLNLSESMYDGFDPTGVAVVFAATATAARILGLTESQTLNALGLAFNRCGASFQSNVDATLAVRVIQGWVAQAGLECAQLALAGITGPANFLTGVYGYRHLFGRDRLDLDQVVAGLGSQWQLDRVVFKKYPSCGATQGMTEIVLQLVRELELRPDSVAEVEVRLNPYCHRLIGHDFQPGDNPRVNAQFSAQYCVANAIVRQSSTLQHFRPAEIADAQVAALIKRVRCVGDPALDARGHSAVDVTLTTRDGRTEHRQLDTPPGFPGNPLSDAEHMARFQSCMQYARHPLPPQQVSAFLQSVANLETLDDARVLVDTLVVPGI
jgi:2-methylcitrate dehydratase PrpD